MTGGARSLPALGGDASDERDVLAPDGGPPQRGPESSAPEEPESMTVPGDHRFRLDDDESVAPLGPDPTEQDPEDPIFTTKPGPVPSALVNHELLAESGVLRGEGRSGADRSPEETEQS
jgi:hypothetical protein